MGGEPIGSINAIGYLTALSVLLLQCIGSRDSGDL